MKRPPPEWGGHLIDAGTAGNGWAYGHCSCHDAWHIVARPMPKPQAAAGEGATP